MGQRLFLLQVVDCTQAGGEEVTVTVHGQSDRQTVAELCRLLEEAPARAAGRRRGVGWAGAVDHRAAHALVDSYAEPCVH